MNPLEEDGVIHPVKGLLDIQEEDRALKDIQLSAEFQHTLDGGEEGMNGVGGGSISTEAELSSGKVVAGLQLLREKAMDDVFERPDDDGRHADRTVGPRLALVATPFIEGHDIRLPPCLGGDGVGP
jgi:hypothetical protein